MSYLYNIQCSSWKHINKKYKFETKIIKCFENYFLKFLSHKTLIKYQSY
jgi:hypothetical protein